MLQIVICNSEHEWISCSLQFIILYTSPASQTDVTWLHEVKLAIFLFLHIHSLLGLLYSRYSYWTVRSSERFHISLIPISNNPASRTIVNNFRIVFRFIRCYSEYIRNSSSTLCIFVFWSVRSIDWFIYLFIEIYLCFDCSTLGLRPSFARMFRIWGGATH